MPVTDDGVSTREAARRFRIGISTAGSWYRRYRETGETQARKQGQPSRSKLDAREAFILGLIEDAPDITLAEIGERLAAERGVRVAPSTVWLFLDRRGITFKKRRRTREAIEKVGARLLFLPPYSPDFNPIEMAFSKLKALLRKAAARTIDELWSVLAKRLAAFTAEECRHYSEAAGYDPE
ncbi:transposase [Mesorhizobium sp. M0815]|uniref:transposase n=1 Tax=Mesorhizobium sp. M0815 TaxID=2957005 RepID=UPI00333C4756